MNDEPDSDELVCGESYEHDAVDTYRGDDGTGWECRRCGAEGWEPADPDPIVEAAKAQSQEVVQPEEAEEVPAAAVDLMAALKASLERARAARYARKEVDRG